jgi:hypothetical protein
MEYTGYPFGPPGPTPRYLQIAGFKSIHPDQPARIEIRGLTLLAGANSSGKSAVMQPILLMKQTLEAAYDPGPLLLDGPHVQFSAHRPDVVPGRRRCDAIPLGRVRADTLPWRDPHRSSAMSSADLPAVRVHFTPMAPGDDRYELAPPTARSPR